MLVLSRFAIIHPRKTMLLAALAVCAAAPGVTRLKLRTDGHALLPSGAPEVQHDRVLREEFGLTDSVIVLIRHDAPDGVYHPQTLRRIVDLTQRLQEMGGLKPSDIFSLATEKGHRVRQGTLQFLTLLDPLPQSPSELAMLRDDIHKLRIYNSTLISADEKATAIYINVPNDADRLAFYSRIRNVLDGLDSGPDEIHITGAPVAESLLGTHILEDLGVPVALLGRDFAWPAEGDCGPPRSFDEFRLWIARHIGLLPVAIIVMSLVFLIAFRSLTATALTGLKIVCCLAIVFGLMGWCGVPIYLTTAVIPVILTAIGVSDEVHIFGRYARNLRQAGLGDSHHEPSAARTTARTAMLAAMTEVWRPVTMTSVTTAIGFLSFALSPLAPVRAFGLFTALGSMICMVWALTATPALSVLVHPRRFVRAARKQPSLEAAPSASSTTPVAPGNVLAAFGQTMMARRRLVLVLFAGLLVAAVFGIRRIEIQDSWIDGFSPAGNFYRSTQLFNDQFLGMHVLFVCVDTGNRKFQGTLDQRDVDHWSVKLPGDLVPNPAVLLTQWIELRRTTPATADEAREIREQGAGRALPPPPSSLPYQSLIVSAVREGDKMVIGLERPKGSPRFRLQLKAGDTALYTLSSRRLAIPETLRVIRELERFLAAHPDEKVGGALGPTAYLETTNYIALGRREEARAIPDDVDRIVYLWNWYGNIRGSDRLRAAVDPDLSRAIISVYLKNANFRDTQRLLDDIQRYQRDRLAPHNISISFAGDVAVSQTMIDAITSTQITSIALSILGVFASAVAVHRSLKWGLLCAIPCAVATPLTLGLMGFAHIPLGVATSMFAAMAIGIGDDYAIHFVERFRLALAAGASTTQGIIETFQAAGPSIIIDALSVALGFSVLTLSQVPANARLGLMVIASIATCFAATLILLPAVLPLLQRGNAAQHN